MARKRMIDPSLWSDEGMLALTARQQLLYIGLFSNADDEGRLKASPHSLMLMLPTVYFSLTPEDVNADLDAVLGIMHKLIRYTVDGRDYLSFCNYRQWQRIDKPTPSILPPPPENLRTIGDMSPNTPRELDDRSTTDPVGVPPSLKEEKLKEEKGTEVNMAPVARVREPDLLFEAVVDVCYHKPHTEITDSEKGRVNKALPELRKAKATPQDVYQRAAEYEQRSPGYALTPQTLTGSWSDLAIPRLAARSSPKRGGARNGEKNGNDWAREIAEEESRERARSQETDRRHRSDLAELPAW